MRQTSPNHIVRQLACVALGISLAVSPSTSQMAGLTIAWDPSVDSVDGYLVHVGTSSGWYGETFDAGRNTVFTYRNGVPGTEYFFVVTAYRSGRSSPPSMEVSGVLGGTPARVETRSSEHGSMSPPGDAGARHVAPFHASVSASCPNAQKCYAVRLRAGGLQPITSLASTPDGELLVVEAGRSVRVVDAQGVRDSVALKAPEGHRITDVAMAPDASTGHVYVGVTHASRGITQSFSIVRYRSVQGRMGEAAVVVAGLAVMNSQSPRMAIDRLGRIYVAMPSGDGTRRDPYAGMILQFNADGTTPAAARAASPVLAAGFEIPSGLTAGVDTLWAFGVDRRWPNVVGRIPLEEAAAALAQRAPALVPGDDWHHPSMGTRVIALSVSPDGGLADQQPWMAYIDSTPLLHVARVAGEAQAVLLRDDAGDLLPDAVLVGHGRRIYVAARDGNGVTLLLELIPQ